jgi:hypothetical protein
MRNPNPYPNLPVASIVHSTTSDINSSQQVVFGIPIQDPEFAKLTRAVLGSAFAMAILALICAILQFVIGTDYVTAVAGSIFIPLFGWFGVRGRKRDCLQAFYICNCVCACLFVYMAIVILTVSLPNVKCLCTEPNCSLLQQYKVTNTTSNQKVLNEVAQYCNNYSRILTANYVSLGLGALMCLLQMFGAYSGKKLRDHQHFNFEVTPDQNGMPLPLPVQPWQQVPFNPYTQGGGNGSLYNPQQNSYPLHQVYIPNALPQYDSQFAQSQGRQQVIGQRIIHPATAASSQQLPSSQSSSATNQIQSFVPPGGRQAPPLQPWIEPVDCSTTTSTTTTSSRR